MITIVCALNDHLVPQTGPHVHRLELDPVTRGAVGGQPREHELVQRAALHCRVGEGAAEEQPDLITCIAPESGLASFSSTDLLGGEGRKDEVAGQLPRHHPLHRLLLHHYHRPAQPALTKLAAPVILLHHKHQQNIGANSLDLSLPPYSYTSTGMLNNIRGKSH